MKPDTDFLLSSRPNFGQREKLKYFLVLNYLLTLLHQNFWIASLVPFDGQSVKGHVSQIRTKVQDIQQNDVTKKQTVQQNCNELEG